MRILAIDCATEACSVALFDNGHLLAGDSRLLGRGHAEQLIPMVSQLPLQGRADKIAVSLGPGSFTGVRIGLAAARALALAWKAEAVGYPTLTLVAAMAASRLGSQQLSVAMTGGHGEYFVQNFTADGAPEGEVASLRPEDAIKYCKNDLVAGTQAQALVEARGYGEAIELRPDARQFTVLTPSTLTPDLSPRYGRAPDARLPQKAPA